MATPPPGYMPWSPQPEGQHQRSPGIQQGLPTLPEPLSKSYSGSSKSPTASPEDELMAMLRSFFEELNKPFDPNDPEVQLVLQNMKANTLQDAGNRGIHGGYSNNLAEQAMARASAGLAMQKKGMAANALGMYTGATQNQRDFNYGRAKDQYQNDLDLYQFEQNNSLPAKIGAGLGAIGGGIAGAFGGDISGGAQAGAQIGSGLGSMFNNKPPPQFKGYG